MSLSEGKSQDALTVAVPVAGNQICMHFGHCEQFALFQVKLNQDQTSSAEIVNCQQLTPPPHEPGLLPRWLREQGVGLVIAGGMGHRAQSIFSDNGIDVVVGVQGGEPEAIVRDYLEGKLQSGQNLCDH